MRRYYFGAHKFNCVLRRFNMSADLPSQETGVALACLTVVRLLSSAIVAVFICLSCVSVRLAYMKLIRHPIHWKLKALVYYPVTRRVIIGGRGGSEGSSKLTLDDRPSQASVSSDASPTLSLTSIRMKI